ncbi:MAG: hypothetical protein ACRCW9_03920 [Cetobacterium sp.]
MGKERPFEGKKTKKPRILKWECLFEECRRYLVDCPSFDKEKDCKRLNNPKFTVSACLQDLCWYDQCPRIFDNCYINFEANPEKPKDKNK